MTQSDERVPYWRREDRAADLKLSVGQADKIGFGDLGEEAAYSRHVRITYHGKVRAVLVGAEELDELVQARDRCLPVHADPWLDGERNERGLLRLPRLEDDHGVATGYTELLESSSIDPSMWVTAVSYPRPACGDLPAQPERNVGLHLRAWQARVLAAQLLHMADRVDPDAVDKPESERTS